MRKPLAAYFRRSRNWLILYNSVNIRSEFGDDSLRQWKMNYDVTILCYTCCNTVTLMSLFSGNI